MILTPESPGFYETLAAPIPSLIGTNTNYVFDTGMGILRPVEAGGREETEYLLGGEYEEAMGHEALLEIEEQIIWVP